MNTKKLTLNKETLITLTSTKTIGGGWPTDSTGCDRTINNPGTCDAETVWCEASVTVCLVSTNPYNCFKTGGTLRGCVGETAGGC